MSEPAMIPHLVVKGAAQAIEFYKAALGAEEVARMPVSPELVPGAPADTGLILHASLKINGATLFICDDMPDFCGGVSRAPAGPSPVTIHLCVENVDATMARAAAAGATVTMPAEDMFWGDRYGQIADPFGHAWSFTHPLANAQAKAA